MLLNELKQHGYVKEVDQHYYVAQVQQRHRKGLFDQSISKNDRGNLITDQFFGADSKQLRVMLNQYNLESYKDGIRIVQEQMRFVFLLVKAISDHLATLAANIGDDNKVKSGCWIAKNI